MSDDFEKLKKIGVQKIHEVTHIARVHVQALLEENFENMNSVQLMGFISILEREYSLDLSSLRERAKEYFKKNVQPVAESTKSVKVFAPSRRKNNLSLIYIALSAIVVLALLFFIFSPKEEKSVIEVDNSAIENAKKSLDAIAQDKNESVKDENLSIQVPQPQEEAVVPSLKIIPRERVWLGYIDLADHKKYQNTFSDEFSLDPSKEWLLAFGHGHIDIEVNGEIKKFKTYKNIRFSYTGSKLQEISFEEFKNMNKGSGW